MPSAIAIAGLIAPVAIVAPVRAAVLNTWNFDTATRQLTITLPTGVTPNYFLLAEPARIVLNVPNTSLGNVAQAQQYDGAIRSIRLSETQNAARVVIEFAPNTLLDPRHAELTSTDLGNGQTEWTLRPLLQDAAPSTIATASSAPSSSSASTPAVRPAPATPQPATATPPPEPTAVPTPPSSESAPPSGPEANPPVTEPTPPTPAPEPTAEEPAPATEAAPVPPASEAESAPIAVIPPPEETDFSAATETALPALPDIANSATTGAAQGLPSGSTLRGVRTDAAALEGIGNENLSDLPPDQIPIDPFAPSSQSTVSVPSLEETDRTTEPQVAVPSIAEVPDAPAAPQPQSPVSSEPTATPNQVRPPGSDAVASTPPTSPPVSAPPTTAPPVATPPAEVPPTPAPPAPSAVAANSIAIPPLPLPPNSWSDRTDTAASPSQIRPPTAPEIAQTPESATDPSDNESLPPATSVSAPVATAADSATPPAATSANTVPPPSAENPPAPPAPSGRESVPSPPAPVSSTPGSTSSAPAATAPLPPPPFLESTGSAPAIEEPSIPPPPTTSPASGTVPFGAPLPQSKALDDDARQRSAAPLSGIPVGTRMALQYSGTEPLVLEQQDPVYEVLTVVGDVYDADTGALILPAGTQVLGRFEGFDESGRRFVTQVVIREGDRLPLLAESDWITGTPQPNPGNVAIGSGIGAAAVTVLTGISGFGIVGGAAVGAAAAAAESPSLVTIDPGQMIEIEVVADILPFNDAPDITRQYR